MMSWWTFDECVTFGGCLTILIIIAGTFGHCKPKDMRQYFWMNIPPPDRYRTLLSLHSGVGALSN